MVNAYVNEDGDIWIERGSAPWPRIQAEAKSMADELGYYPSVLHYEGIEQGIRVTDEHEMPHGDDDACADSQGVEYGSLGFTPCCRTVTAHHFRAEET